MDPLANVTRVDLLQMQHVRRISTVLLLPAGNNSLVEVVGVALLERGADLVGVLV